MLYYMHLFLYCSKTLVLNSRIIAIFESYFCLQIASLLFQILWQTLRNLNITFFDDNKKGKIIGSKRTI